MAKRDPYKWRGKLGIETGPVPIKRWVPHSVTVTIANTPEQAKGRTAQMLRPRKGQPPGGK